MLKHSRSFFHLANICSTDDLRPAMNGVLYEEKADGGYEATATDGHVLLNVKGIGEKSDEQPEAWRGIIPSYTLKSFSKLGRKAFLLGLNTGKIVLKTVLQTTMRQNREILEYRFPDFELKEKPTKEAYPNWKSIVPQGTPYFKIAVNPKKLIQVLTAMTAIQEDSDTNGVVLSFYNSVTGIRIESKKDKEILGLVMPMRNVEVHDIEDANEFHQQYQTFRNNELGIKVTPATLSRG